MTAESSPRPWKTVGTYRDIIVGADGVKVCELYGELGTQQKNAELIVKAVNLHEWLVEHNKLNAESVCELFEERDRLRDFVSRLADLSWNLLANYEARYGFDRNSMDFVENNRALISEARAAIRKEGRLP